MADTFEISAEWEPLENGSLEERATFAAIGIALNNIWLTEADDIVAGRVRQHVHLSAYRLAEWFAWNWWRLRWEPVRRSTEWRLAHRMASIGGGYVWPNITFSPDGQRVSVEARPTEGTPSEPLRYIKNYHWEIQAELFESTIDSFIDRVCAKLSSEKITDSNVELIWRDVQEERLNPEVSKRRRLEAMLGFDPDEADAALIEKLMSDAEVLGEVAMRELVAANPNKVPPTKDEISSWANKFGIKRDPRNSVKLESERSIPTKVEAWRRGNAIARALRKQEAFGDRPIPTNALCELMGSSPAAAKESEEYAPMSFAFDENVASGKIVMRSRRETGRRFGVARLLGDKLGCPSSGRLTSTSDADTYRQKLQRAFATEFLSPFHVIDEMLDEDYSEEKIEGVAQHFNVSPLSIRASLANRHKIDRGEVWQEG